jgi:tRNA pseudouridine55 synthase
MRLGFATATGDRTGTKIDEADVPQPPAVSTTDIERVLPRFLGEIEQVPPMYSAKKIEGKKLYQHARAGNEIRREPVKVRITHLKLFDPSRIWPEQSRERLPGISNIGLNVVCSAGTYIRTLAEDIALAAGARAHLAELRRTRAGKFTIGEAVTLERLEQMDDPASAVLPMQMAVSHLPPFELREDRVAPTRNGMSTRLNVTNLANGEVVRMLASDGELVAIGVFDLEDGCVRPTMVLG